MRFLSPKEVTELTCLSGFTIYKYIEEGLFPRSVPLGGRAVAWVDQDVHDWVLARIEERDQSKPVFSGRAGV